VSLRRAAAVLVALAALTACGVKAPPRPPERHAPGAVPPPAAAAEPEASACEDGCGSTPTPTPTKAP
jgi:hypothetical protein